MLKENRNGDSFVAKGEITYLTQDCPTIALVETDGTQLTAIAEPGMNVGDDVIIYQSPKTRTGPFAVDRTCRTSRDYEIALDS